MTSFKLEFFTEPGPWKEALLKMLACARNMADVYKLETAMTECEGNFQ